MKKEIITRLRPTILLFVLLNGFFITGRTWLAKWGADQTVLIAGNLILFLVTVVSYFVFTRSLRSENPQSFVRAMYLNVMIKLFVCVIAAFVYIRLAGKDLSKPALFICMGLYVVYTVLEITTLTKQLKRIRKNA